MSLEKKEQWLKSINFFIGGLTDEAIEYYYTKLVAQKKRGLK